MHALENDTIGTTTGRVVQPDSYLVRWCGSPTWKMIPRTAPKERPKFRLNFPSARHFGVGRMTLLNKKTLAVLAITVAALPIFALVDPQSTVRIKATFINLLPIDAQIKTDAIKNLCQAAYVGNSSFERFDCISSLSRE
jgi:hypothetical protein